MPDYYNYYALVQYAQKPNGDAVKFILDNVVKFKEQDDIDEMNVNAAKLYVKMGKKTCAAQVLANVQSKEGKELKKKLEGKGDGCGAA